MKAAARPENFEFPGPGAKKIDPGHLKKPSQRSHPNTKGGTIPGGMHGTGGPSGKTLSLQELVELLGPAILGAFNAPEKVGNLLGGRPNQGITHTQVADIAGAAHTKLTEQRLVDSVIGDTVDVNNFQPDMAAIMSPPRQARNEREEEGVLEANARLSTPS